MIRQQTLLHAAGCLAFSLLVGACSDPVSPPAKGGLSIRVMSPPDGQCNTTFQATIPSIGAPTPSSAGEPLTDGEQSSQVSCAVRADGDGYAVSGSLFLGQISFTIAGHVPASGPSAADVVVTAQNNQTGSSRLQGRTCVVTVGSSPQTVSGGEIFATFSCPIFDDSMSPAEPCATEGTFVFERCSN
jgi:hypothetical protein